MKTLLSEIRKIAQYFDIFFNRGKFLASFEGCYFYWLHMESVNQFLNIIKWSAINYLHDSEKRVKFLNYSRRWLYKIMKIKKTDQGCSKRIFVLISEKTTAKYPSCQNEIFWVILIWNRWNLLPISEKIKNNIFDIIRIFETKI